MATLPAILRDEISASDAAASNYFGFAVASNSDGTVLAVGAPRKDYNSLTQLGRVYIYDWNGSDYIERSIIDSPILENYNRFGQAVALNGDGTILAVGAWRNYHPTYYSIGEVVVYEWNGSAWNYRETIDSLFTQEEAEFGAGIALDSTGTKLVVGTPGYDSNPPLYDDIGDYDGAVYTLTYSGGVWSQVGSRLDHRIGVNDYTNFGRCVALSRDGLVLAVSEKGSSPTYAAAHIYDWVTNNWVYRYSVDGPGTGEYVQSLALDNIGDRLLVGYYPTTAGLINVFDLGSSSYTYIGDYERISAPTAGDRFGSGVAITADKSLVVAGIYYGAIPVVGITGFVQTFGFPISGSGNIELLSVTGSGTAERTTFTGVGSSTLVLSASGLGRVRSYMTSYLGAQSSLAVGWESGVLYTPFEYAIPVFQKEEVYLGASYAVKIYEGTRIVVKEFTYSVNAYLQTVSFINTDYSLSAYVTLIGRLLSGYRLDVFKASDASVNIFYKLNAATYRSSELNNEYRLTAFNRVIDYVQGTYGLFSFKPYQSSIGLQWEFSAPTLRTFNLLTQYSVNVYQSAIAYLISQTDLQCFIPYKNNFTVEYYLYSHVNNSLAIVNLAYGLDSLDVINVYVYGLDTGTNAVYTNYDFNSISGGLAASESGIYALNGTDDAGTYINTSITSAKSDLGSNYLKRVTDAYIGVNTDGNIELTITTESGTISYRLTGVNELKTLKSNLARGAKGRFWEFTLNNVNGSSVYLYSLDVLPDILSRRK